MTDQKDWEKKDQGTSGSSGSQSGGAGTGGTGGSGTGGTGGSGTGGTGGSGGGSGLRRLGLRLGARARAARLELRVPDQRPARDRRLGLRLRDRQQLRDERRQGSRSPAAGEWGNKSGSGSGGQGESDMARARQLRPGHERLTMRRADAERPGGPPGANVADRGGQTTARTPWWSPHPTGVGSKDSSGHLAGESSATSHGIAPSRMRHWPRPTTDATDGE